MVKGINAGEDIALVRRKAVVLLHVAGKRNRFEAFAQKIGRWIGQSFLQSFEGIFRSNGSRTAQADVQHRDRGAAFQSGQFGNSLRAAEEALRAKGKDQGALSIAAISACNLKNRDKALTYLNQLQGERRNMAKQSCLRQGITPE